LPKRIPKTNYLSVIKKQKLFVHHQLYDVNEEDENHFIEDVEDVLDKIKADKNEPLLPLSNRFWEEYETIKNYSTNNKKNNKPLPENTLQTKAIIVLRSLLEVKDNPHITLLKPFIRMLLEDLLDYGTLSQYTLRRISNIDIKKNLAKGINELKALEEELGCRLFIRGKTTHLPIVERNHRCYRKQENRLKTIHPTHLNPFKQ
jgi:hypothetical protein